MPNSQLISGRDTSGTRNAGRAWYVIRGLLCLGLLAWTLCSAQEAPDVKAAGSYVDVGGAKLWYEECGPANSGAAVVLLHDGLVHSITWRYEAPGRVCGHAGRKPGGNSTPWRVWLLHSG